MFDNIGRKIKMLATVITIAGIAASAAVGVGLMTGNQHSASYYGYGYHPGPITVGFIPGLIIMILGALGSWVGSFLLYGFGELIEKV